MERYESYPMNSSVIDTKAITRAWQALQSSLPIPLKTIKTDKHYQSAVRLMNELLDQVGDDENHKLAVLLDTVAVLVACYEREQAVMPNGSPSDVLRFLMQQNNLKQTDLISEMGSQSVVSAVLRGKRVVNGRQAKALAARFAVSSDLFL
jgi:HTH-type transcriptional regulator / antitoxin HigA